MDTMACTPNTQVNICMYPCMWSSWLVVFPRGLAYPPRSLYFFHFHICACLCSQTQQRCQSHKERFVLRRSRHIFSANQISLPARTRFCGWGNLCEQQHLCNKTVFVFFFNFHRDINCQKSGEKFITSCGAWGDGGQCFVFQHSGQNSKTFSFLFGSEISIYFSYFFLFVFFFYQR